MDLHLLTEANIPLKSDEQIQNYTVNIFTESTVYIGVYSMPKNHATLFRVIIGQAALRTLYVCAPPVMFDPRSSCSAGVPVHLGAPLGHSGGPKICTVIPCPWNTLSLECPCGTPKKAKGIVKS